MTHKFVKHSIFISEDSQMPVLEDREGEWKKPPIMQEEAVNHLPCHLGTYKSMGWMGSTQEC